MARTNMNEMLRKRMSATQQASEQQTGGPFRNLIVKMPCFVHVTASLFLSLLDGIQHYRHAATPE